MTVIDSRLTGQLGSVLLDAVGWPAIALAVSVLVTVLFWLGFQRWIPDATRAAGLLGVFVLFGQTLDGVTTIIGIDVLGFTEQVPLSRLVLALAGHLPTASVFGVGWALFVLKLALVTGLLIAFRPDTNERDAFTDFALVFAGVAGLWPGINNLVLQASI